MNSTSKTIAKLLSVVTMAINVAYSALALAVGIFSSTKFMAMNTTLNYIAFPAYYLPDLQTLHRTNKLQATCSTPESSPALLLRQWTLTYRTGHLIGPASVILSTAAFIYASRTCPPELKTQLYAAAASAAVAFPFTVVFIVPVNLELFRRVDALEASENLAEQEKMAGGDTQALITKCLWYSKIRALMPVPAVVLAVYTIFQMLH
jgi:hypothetical protein